MRSESAQAAADALAAYLEMPSGHGVHQAALVIDKAIDVAVDKLQAKLRERDRQVAEWIERGQALQVERDQLKDDDREQTKHLESIRKTLGAAIYPGLDIDCGINGCSNTLYGLARKVEETLASLRRELEHMQELFQQTQHVHWSWVDIATKCQREHVTPASQVAGLRPAREVAHSMLRRLGRPCTADSDNRHWWDCNLLAERVEEDRASRPPAVPPGAAACPGCDKSVATFYAVGDVLRFEPHGTAGGGMCARSRTKVPGPLTQRSKG